MSTRRAAASKNISYREDSDSEMDISEEEEEDDEDDDEEEIEKKNKTKEKEKKNSLQSTSALFSAFAKTQKPSGDGLTLDSKDKFFRKMKKEMDKYAAPSSPISSPQGTRVSSRLAGRERNSLKELSDSEIEECESEEEVIVQKNRKKVIKVDEDEEEDEEENDEEDEDEDEEEEELNFRRSSRTRKPNILFKSPEKSSRPSRTSTIKESEPLRRSSRATSRPTYYQESEEDDDDEEEEEEEENEEEEDEKGDEMDDDENFELKVQTVLSSLTLKKSEWLNKTVYMNTRYIKNGSIFTKDESASNNSSSSSSELETRYLIKWFSLSYLHCSWETHQDLDKHIGKLAVQAVKRFVLKEQEVLFEDLGTDEYFPLNYTELERVLDVTLPPSSSEKIKIVNANIEDLSSFLFPNMKLLVKWEGLSYSEATYETVLDLSCCTSKALKYHPRPNIEEEEKKTENNQEKDEIELLDKKNNISNYSENNLNQNQNYKNLGPNLEFLTLLIEYIQREKKINDKTKRYMNRIRLGFIHPQTHPQIFSKNKHPFVCELNSPHPSLFIQDILDTKEAPLFNGNTLRDYQWIGLKWLLFNIQQGRNSILADEMGLGKTIQSSTLMEMLYKKNPNCGPLLVVAPLSTLQNWYREIKTWTTLDCVVYYGSQEDRSTIRQNDFYFDPNKHDEINNNNNILNFIPKVDIVITTPETCLASDHSKLGGKSLTKIFWDLIIVDEAHKLKNYDSKFSTVLRQEYHYKNCMLLTGTPLQNNTEELWSLLNFIDREKFGDKDTFMEEFGDLKSSSQLDKLQKLIKPYMLRREKQQVEKSVPPKKEIIIDVDLTLVQKQYYRAIYEQKTQFLFKSGNFKDGPSLNNLAMELRKCCNHPFLIKGARDELEKEYLTIESNHHQLSSHDLLVRTSGKLQFLSQLLPILKADGHRVLIFSQFRIMLDLLEEFLHGEGLSFDRIDGAIRGVDRQKAIDRFMNKSNAENPSFIMLLSTKAGGVGINLTAADTVILFDSDYNPTNDIQAQARAHRIGQSKPVTVFRLLMKNSYEKIMFASASKKLGLEYAVMYNLNYFQQKNDKKKENSDDNIDDDDKNNNNNTKSLSKKELENLLKFGAYEIFMKDSNTSSDPHNSISQVDLQNSLFSNDKLESLENILSRSIVFKHKGNNVEDNSLDITEEKHSEALKCLHDDKRVDVEVDSTGKVSMLNDLSSASFISNEKSSSINGQSEDVQVSLDDPDFWKKVVGVVEEDQQKEEEIYEYDEDGNIRRRSRRKKKAVDILEVGIEETSTDDSETPTIGEFSISNIFTIFASLGKHFYSDWHSIKNSSRLNWVTHSIIEGSRYSLLGALFSSILKPISVQTLENDAKDNISFDYSPNKVTVTVIMQTKLLDQEEENDIEIEKENIKKSKNSSTSTSSSAANLDNSKSEIIFSIDYQNILNTFNKHKIIRLCFLSTYLALKNNKQDDYEKFILSIFLSSTSKLSKENGEFNPIKLDDLFNQALIEFEPSFSSTTTSQWFEEALKLVLENTESSTYLIARSCAVKSRPIYLKNKLFEVDDLFEVGLFIRIVNYNGLNSDNNYYKEFFQSYFSSLYSENNEESSLFNIDIDIALINGIFIYGVPSGRSKNFNKFIEESIINNNNDEDQDEEKQEDEENNINQINKKIDFKVKDIVTRIKLLAKNLRIKILPSASSKTSTEKKDSEEQPKLTPARILSVFKYIQRGGYPREIYEKIIKNKDNLSYLNEDFLLTWDKFSSEIKNISENELKEIVYEGIKVFNDSDQFTTTISVDGNDSVVVENGILANIPFKAIESAFSLSHLVYNIRLVLALNSPQEINKKILDNAKILIKSNLPKWWDNELHDYFLLKESIGPKASGISPIGLRKLGTDFYSMCRFEKEKENEEDNDQDEDEKEKDDKDIEKVQSKYLEKRILKILKLFTSVEEIELNYYQGDQDLTPSSPKIKKNTQIKPTLTLSLFSTKNKDEEGEGEGEEVNKTETKLWPFLLPKKNDKKKEKNIEETEDKEIKKLNDKLQDEEITVTSVKSGKRKREDTKKEELEGSEEIKTQKKKIVKEIKIAKKDKKEVDEDEVVVLEDDNNMIEIEVVRPKKRKELIEIEKENEEKKKKPKIDSSSTISKKNILSFFSKK